MVFGLATAAVGIAVNAVLIRTFIALTYPDTASRIRFFSHLNVIVNVVAAFAPALGTLLYRENTHIVYAVVVVCYAIAAAVSLVLIPRTEGHEPRSDESSHLTAPRSQRRLLRVLAITCIGWALYAQLFSVLPAFMVSANLGTLAALAFTANGIMIILVQIPVARRLARRGLVADPGRPLLAAVLLYSLSFVLLGLLPPNVVSLMVAIVVFTFAEVLFAPSVDAACLEEAGQMSAATVLGRRQLVTAIGEAVGGGVGLALFMSLSRAGSSQAYWLLLGMVGLLLLIPLLRRPNPSSAAPAAIPEGL